jgi:hypothetical protein
MNKQTFTKYLKELVAIKEAEEGVNTALKKFDRGWNWFSLGRYETLVVDILKEAMDDKDDWIGYWIWELDCGKEAKRNTITLNGKNIPIKTISDLYNILQK